MKRLLICTTALVSLVAATASAEWTVTFSGNNKFEAGARKLTGNQNRNFPLTANQNSAAFISTSKAAVNVTNKVDNMTYGASIRLAVVTNQGNGTDRDSRMDRSHLFMDSDMGSVQLGTNIAASKMMKVDAGLIASATGGIDGDYSKFLGTPANEALGINNVGVASMANNKVTYNGVIYNGSTIGDFPIFSQFAITSVDTLSNRLDGSVESSNKITYISPRVEGVQFGVSFTPDNSNGGNSLGSTLYGSNPAYLTYGNTLRLKNIWSLGLNYMNTFNDVNVEVGLTGDFGNAVQQRLNNSTVTDSSGTATGSTPNATTFGTGNSQNAHNLKSYTAGLMLEKNGFSVAGSYSDDSNSGVPNTMYIDNNVANATTTAGTTNLTPTLATGKFKSNWWTAGVGFANGPMSTSLTYLDGQRGFANAKLKTKALSLGADYEVVTGFKPFAEVTYAKFSPSGALNVMPSSGLKATTFILGTRVKF